MALLKVLKGPNQGTLIPFENGRDTFVLGRSASCFVPIPMHSVSREHAQILRVQGQFFIEDKQSHNGTLVNNRRITDRTRLKDLDVISIGDCVLAFVDHDARLRAAPAKSTNKSGKLPAPSATRLDEKPVEKPRIDPSTKVKPYANGILVAVTCLISGAVLAGWRPGEPDIARPDLDELWRAEVKKRARGPMAEKAMEVIGQQIAVPASFPLALRSNTFSVSQLFTHLFVHAEPLHLVVNMIFLLILGSAVNAKLGNVYYIPAYLALGGVAGLAWLVLRAGQPDIGPAGALFGIAGLSLVFFPRNNLSIYYWWSWSTIGKFVVPAEVVVALFFVWDLFATRASGTGFVGLFAHLTGALAGGAVAVCLLKWKVVASADDEENLLQLLGLEKSNLGTEKKDRKKRRRFEWVARKRE